MKQHCALLVYFSAMEPAVPGIRDLLRG